MSLNTKTFLAASLLLAACDTGRTNLGTLVAKGEGSGECEEGWSMTTPVRNDEWYAAPAVLGIDDGFLLGGTPRAGEVTRLDAEGDVQWTTKLGEPGLASVKDILQADDGDFIVSIHDHDSTQASGREVRAARVSPSGEIEWNVHLGSAHFMAWVEADVMHHPDGGFLVSWHDSMDDGLSPSTALARIDDQGSILWTVEHDLSPDSPTAINWALGAAAVLGDGSVLQLTSDGPYLRLLRTAADGSPISDARVHDVTTDQDLVAWPKDIVALPDGGVLVLANDGAQVMVIEVEPGGSIRSTHVYAGGDDPFGDVLAWDPEHEALLLAGNARDDGKGWSRPWVVVTDREGDVLFEALHIDDSLQVSTAYDASWLPSGGFIVSRHGESMVYETVVPCAGD